MTNNHDWVELFASDTQREIFFPRRNKDESSPLKNERREKLYVLLNRRIMKRVNNWFDYLLEESEEKELLMMRL